MTLSPIARHRLDRAWLVLTALAVLVLLVLSTAAAGGSDHVIVRTCLVLLLVARLVPWLTRQHAAHPNTVAGLSALAAFIGTVFLLTHPAMDGPVTILGRLVVLFGLPALVVWKLDPESFRSFRRTPRPEHDASPTTDVR